MIRIPFEECCYLINCIQVNRRWCCVCFELQYGVVVAVSCSYHQRCLLKLKSRGKAVNKSLIMFVIYPQINRVRLALFFTFKSMPFTFRRAATTEPLPLRAATIRAVSLFWKIENMNMKHDAHKNNWSKILPRFLAR